MSRPPVSLKEQVEEIVSSVSSELGQRDVGDRYPCLLRIGDDWEKYPFPWEPFRDLAGLLEWPETAPPIVFVSNRAKKNEPLVGTFSDPHPHLRISVSPAVHLVAILNTWVEQLIGYFPEPATPIDWFLKQLQLKPMEVSPEVRQFLGLEPSRKKEPTQLSVTVKEIIKDLGSSEVSAFTLAEQIQTRHGEYASHRLAEVQLVPPEGVAVHAWEDWRDSVANLYDQSALAGSQHEVIDGRLLLAGLGLLEPALLEALEEAGAWAPLLLEIDEAVVPTSGHLRNALKAIQLAHGYKSDRPDGDDQLSFQGEVNALCEVIMDPDVSPPLAVGLFGSWGSGKSFFMEKMRERVYELTSSSPEDRPKNVVQIRFNAWHYADTSLWASIAVEIFERLADPEPIDHEQREQWLIDRGDPKRKEREKLLTNLETFREARATLEKEREHLQEEQTRLRKVRQNAKTARKKAIESSSLLNVAAELVKDTQIKAGLTEISQNLGMTPAVDQLTELAKELHTASGYFTAIWRKVENKSFAVGLFAAALVLLVYAAATGSSSWFEGLLPAIGSVVSVVVAATKYLRPAAQSVNRGLATISTTIETVTEAEQRLLAKRSSQERQLDLLLADHNEQISESTKSIAALNEQIATLTSQADALAVGRGLNDFLADRADGYQKHLGVVGMLHRDFRLLDAQLRAQSASDENSGLPQIERVVLYVDDLDRCSPEKVLEVLETVHLLLALELFIVVVGVDPRWLQRSLRYQYRDLCLSNEPSKDPYLQAMPTEYLEKIFQIPLTLPAMETAAYGKLVSSLAPGTALPSAEPAPEVSTGPTHRAVIPDSPGGSRAPTRALLQVQEGSAAQGSGGKSIDLTSEEVLFAQQLGGLVDTPRAAKRLMNTYRLIRATQHVGSRSRFLGTGGEPGEYFAALTLLAVAAGYPTLADRLLVALEEDAATHQIADWEAFLNELEPAKGRLVPNDIANPKDDDLIAKAAAAEWENMYNGLRASLNGNKLRLLQPYKHWGRTVARFSFTL